MGQWMKSSHFATWASFQLTIAFRKENLFESNYDSLSISRLYIQLNVDLFPRIISLTFKPLEVIKAVSRYFSKPRASTVGPFGTWMQIFSGLACNRTQRKFQAQEIPVCKIVKRFWMGAQMSRNLAIAIILALIIKNCTSLNELGNYLIYVVIFSQY